MTDATTAQRAGGGLMPFVRRYTMELILLALIVFLIFTAPGFASLANTLNVLRTVAMLGIIAFGMTAVIIAGEIDLSVGAGAALAGCIVAWFGVNYTESWGGTAALGFGFLCALVVGFFTVDLRRAERERIGRFQPAARSARNTAGIGRRSVMA